MKKKLFVLLVWLTVIPMFAGGYRVALQGARMLGMAHAGTAVFSNAEVLFFNPSGAAYLNGDVNVSFGLNLVWTKVKYQNKTYLWTAETQNPIGTPFYVYVSLKQTDNIYYGFALYTPFGSGLKWEEGWPGAHLVNEISLKAIYFQPTITYKVNDYLALSAGFIAAWGSVYYNKDINRFMVDEEGNKTDITLDASGVTGAGYVLSGTLRPADWVSLGINYRSKVLFNARYGKATVNDAPAYFPTTDAFSATLPMPAELSVGLSVRPVEKLTFAFDINRTYWSVYESLDIDFKTVFPDNKMPKNWQNTFTYRAGAEYAFTDQLKLRAGMYYDESPIPPTYFSPETPTSNAHGYTFGFSYSFNKYHFDFAFLYVNGAERLDSYDYYKEGLSAPRFDGAYVSNAVIPSFGFSIQL